MSDALYITATVGLRIRNPVYAHRFSIGRAWFVVTRVKHFTKEKA